MSDKDGFEPILGAVVKGGTMEVAFPVPSGAEGYVLSVENVERAVEYYLLARHAIQHRMQASFMINSFWAAEHLILSLFDLSEMEKDDLKELGGFHNLTKYWEAAKSCMGEDQAALMSRFDSYIATVKGYYSERYPTTTPARGKLTHSGKMPRVSKGTTTKPVRFGKVLQLNLGDLDHFVNFMLHDITVYSADCPQQLASLLARYESADLYKRENEFSVIYPNQKYSGEK